MSKYSNTSAVPLSLAVFLASDSYDYNNDINTISATTLIKPVRQIVLSSRVPTEDAQVDLAQMMASRIGTAIHDGIERSWKQNYKNALTAIGIPEKVINNIKINPTPEELTDDTIAIYMEKRAHKAVGKYTVSGKFDFIGDGRVEDFKTTSVWTAMNNANDEKYILQGSIYRWLNPDLITKDDMAIQYIFTDWSAMRARTEATYPKQRNQQKIFPLKSINETDAYIRNKLSQIDKYMEAPESEIPKCTDEDLWRSDPVFKYYKNPEKLARSTKNFDNKQDAYIRMAEDKGVGIVIEQAGQVTACKYCQAFSVCCQKDELINSGDLVIN